MHVGGYYFQVWKDANEGMRICALLFTYGEPSGQSILFQQHCVDFIFGRFPVLRAVSLHVRCRRRAPGNYKCH